MNASSEDIKDMLLAYGDYSGLDIVFPGNVSIGVEPTSPINNVTILDTPGFAPDLNVDGAVGYEYPSIQIRVRNSRYRDGWYLIDRIKEALHGKRQETWNGTFYSVIYCSSGPALLDWNDNNNPRFIVNFNLQRRPA